VAIMPHDAHNSVSPISSLEACTWQRIKKIENLPLAFAPSVRASHLALSGTDVALLVQMMRCTAISR